MKISKHLSLEEVTSSEYAVKHNINNIPTEAQLNNLKLIAEKVFEPMREHFDKPIRVSSGYRSRVLNKAIGGATTSQHCTGEALDIDNRGGEILNAQIFYYIKDNLEFDQLIWEFGNSKEPSWVHVSFSKNHNRKQILKAKKVNGKSSYTNF
jgi:hypothetical protein